MEIHIIIGAIVIGVIVASAVKIWDIHGEAQDKCRQHEFARAVFILKNSRR